MNKVLQKLILSLFLSLLILSPASAGLISASKKKEAFTTNLNQASNGNYNSEISLQEMMSSAIRLFLSTLGTIFIILIFFDANKWMRSNGNEEKVAEAKEGIRNLIIGLVVVVAAYALSYTVSSALSSFLLNK